MEWGMDNGGATSCLGLGWDPGIMARGGEASCAMENGEWKLNFVIF